MNLNRRIEILENTNEGSYGYHIIILADGEADEDAAMRYCCENDFSIEQLKHVIYVQYEDAALL